MTKKIKINKTLLKDQSLILLQVKNEGGYLKNLGRHELEQAAGKWQTLHKDEKVSLEPVYMMR